MLQNYELIKETLPSLTSISQSLKQNLDILSGKKPDEIKAAVKKKKKKKQSLFILPFFKKVKNRASTGTSTDNKKTNASFPIGNNNTSAITGPNENNDNDDDDEDDEIEIVKGGSVHKADYGPPYHTDDYPEGTSILIEECSKVPIKLVEVHLLLNERVDPNLVIPTDPMLYTAMHWCARSYNLPAMKMLHLAKANINPLSLLYQTPLVLALLVKQKPHTDHRKRQLQVIRFLVENGSYVNLRDKGGLTCLDYAAMNDDVEIISLLLARGAKVRPVNTIFTVKQQHILEILKHSENQEIPGVNSLEDHNSNNNEYGYDMSGENNEENYHNTNNNYFKSIKHQLNQKNSSSNANKLNNNNGHMNDDISNAPNNTTNTNNTVHYHSHCYPLLFKAIEKQTKEEFEKHEQALIVANMHKIIIEKTDEEMAEKKRLKKLTKHRHRTNVKSLKVSKKRELNFQSVDRVMMDDDHNDMSYNRMSGTSVTGRALTIDTIESLKSTAASMSGKNLRGVLKTSVGSGTTAVNNITTTTTTTMFRDDKTQSLDRRRKSASTVLLPTLALKSSSSSSSVLSSRGKKNYPSSSSSSSSSTGMRDKEVVHLGWARECDEHGGVIRWKEITTKKDHSTTLSSIHNNNNNNNNNNNSNGNNSINNNSNNNGNDDLSITHNDVSNTNNNNNNLNNIANSINTSINNTMLNNNNKSSSSSSSTATTTTITDHPYNTHSPHPTNHVYETAVAEMEYMRVRDLGQRNDRVKHQWHELTGRYIDS